MGKNPRENIVLSQLVAGAGCFFLHPDDFFSVPMEEFVGGPSDPLRAEVFLGSKRLPP